jgi:serine/threonine-protein kinase SRPK3
LAFHFRHVAIKVICAEATKANAQGVMAELQISPRITSANPIHPGRSHLLLLLHHFRTQSQHRKHQYLVTPTLGGDVYHLQVASEDNKLPLRMVTQLIQQPLLALNYIHSECQIIHTGAWDLGRLAFKDKRDGQISSQLIS